MTVVVASRNRRAQLLRYLPRHEAPVILVDNASEDGTAEAVSAALPHVHVVRSAVNLGAAGRNVGAELAETRFVAFADDDSYWEAGSLGKAAALLDAHPRAALLTGQVLVGADGRADPISAAMEAAPLGTPTDLPGPSVLGFLACAAVVRRDAFLAVGGFNPTLHVYGEEALLAMDLAAAGWGLAYVPALTVRHLPLPAGRDVAGRRRRQARNDLLTSWLRRPLPIAAAAARSAWRTGGPARGGLADAARLLPWVLRHRRPLPAHVEAAVRTLASAAPAGA
ncbi:MULTISPECIES: glycosyltransferase family 2 protein [Catenuloplanes]|uniref:GT2 family glycosyltransferase n=1 Tax=Catenuloplanes niger TaxID=587534 RepID=A0AAE3ZM66_9ACTN|nr:glycosyltransferase [Catenuloplanes niger]MDR7322327.1 GT2 family glycosyltransferase [Catenuloplanes niger]